MGNHSIINIFIQKHLLNTYLSGAGSISDAVNGGMKKIVQSTAIIKVMKILDMFSTELCIE